MDGTANERAQVNQNSSVKLKTTNARGELLIARGQRKQGEWTDAPVRPEAPDGVHTGQAIESAQYLVSSQSASGELDDMGRRKGLCRKLLRSLT